MVTGTAEPATGPAEVPTAGQVAARRWRGLRFLLIAVLALIVITVSVAMLRPDDIHQDQDPTSPGPGGTRALAEILRQNGTPVRVERDAQDAAGNVLRGRVLVITRTERLTDADIALLGTTGADLLLVDPPTDVLDGLAPGVTKASVSHDPVAEPGCGLPAATLAGSVQFESSEVYQAPPGAVGCYADDNGLPRLVQLQRNGRTVTVLGTAGPMTNDLLDELGNASLAMNLAGTGPSVTWLVPDPPAPGEGSGEDALTDLLPFGAKLFFLQLLVAVVLVALWRSRRLGPVVAERLPVIVRSSETVEGRSRLYRARAARDRAADAIRAGTRERLVPLLGLPRSAAQDLGHAQEIVAAVAARTTYDEAAVGAALYGPEPVDDVQLVGLTDVLDELERQVRQS